MRQIVAGQLVTPSTPAHVRPVDPRPATREKPKAEPDRPSLDVIRTELDIEAAAQAKRGETADTRAGVVLAAAGTLAGLAVNVKLLQVLPGAVAALVASVLAAGVFLPRRRNAVNPVELRRRYARQLAETTKLQVLDNRIRDFAANEKIVAAKLTLLRWAVAAIVLAILLVVGGASSKLLIDLAG